jgi:hypothetical protein
VYDIQIVAKAAETFDKVAEVLEGIDTKELMG